jgi:hypothetical protein
VADTWQALSQGVTFASAKSEHDVFNAAASTKSIDCYRFVIWNNQTAAIAAALTLMVIRRTSAASAGTAITPVAHQTASAALNANTTAGNGRTVTGVATFRRWLWLTEEATTTGVTQANWEIMVPNTQIYLPTAGDANLQPLRAVTGSDQGYDIQNAGAAAVGTADLEITFTNV